MAHAVTKAPQSRALVQPADRIVVPVLGSDRGFIAEQWAAELAAALGIPLVAIHVETRVEAVDSMGELELFAFVTKECARWSVPLETRIVRGTDVAAEIVAELKPRDLVVVGSERMHGQFRVESVAAEIVKRAPCPVQLVRLE